MLTSNTKFVLPLNIPKSYCYQVILIVSLVVYRPRVRLQDGVSGPRHAPLAYCGLGGAFGIAAVFIWKHSETYNESIRPISSAGILQ